MVFNHTLQDVGLRYLRDKQTVDKFISISSESNYEGKNTLLHGIAYNNSPEGFIKLWNDSNAAKALTSKQKHDLLSIENGSGKSVISAVIEQNNEKLFNAATFGVSQEHIQSLLKIAQKDFKEPLLPTGALTIESVNEQLKAIFSAKGA